MPRACEHEHDAVGNVFRLQRVDALVHRRGLLGVALETHDRELRLRQAGVDGADADRAAEQIFAQRIREAAHCELRRDVARRAFVRLAAGDRSEVDDVAAVTDVRQAEARHAHEPVHVRAEDRLLVLLGRLVKRCTTECEPGVVDEDVEAAELLGRSRDEVR